MKMATKKSPLGKGLSALLGPDFEDSHNDRLMYIDSDLITISKYQPRTHFDEKQINELAASIREVGILQPLVVRSSDHGGFELIAGERRLRASIVAGLTQVPVIVKEFDNKQSFEAALIENIQRTDLSPIEEALGYQQFIEEFNYTQDQLSEFVGKSRSYLANTLRLLNLPDKIKRYVHEGLITPGHARALLTAENADELAEAILTKKLNVRQAEALSRKKITTTTRKTKIETCEDEDILSLQSQLSNILQSDVSILIQGHKGQIKIEFESLEQLDELITKLSCISDYENREKK